VKLHQLRCWQSWRMTSPFREPQIAKLRTTINLEEANRISRHEEPREIAKLRGIQIRNRMELKSILCPGDDVISADRLVGWCAGDLRAP